MQRGDLIRVLGPIDVLTADGERSVGSGMSRRLLGALVLGAGRAIPSGNCPQGAQGTQGAQAEYEAMKESLDDDVSEHKTLAIVGYVLPFLFFLPLRLLLQLEIPEEYLRHHMLQ